MRLGLKTVDFFISIKIRKLKIIFVCRRVLCCYKKWWLQRVFYYLNARRRSKSKHLFYAKKSTLRGKKRAIKSHNKKLKFIDIL